jgi:hypothetical protein
MRSFSVKARPMNDRPIGSPATNPAGTVIFGKPDTAANDELPIW